MTDHVEENDRHGDSGQSHLTPPQRVVPSSREPVSSESEGKVPHLLMLAKVSDSLL